MNDREIIELITAYAKLLDLKKKMEKKLEKYLLIKLHNISNMNKLKNITKNTKGVK